MNIIRIHKAIYLRNNMTLRLLRFRLVSDKNLSGYLRHTIALHQKLDGLLLHEVRLRPWQTSN
jgi:hypothetical protein